MMKRKKEEGEFIERSQDVIEKAPRAWIEASGHSCSQSRIDPSPLQSS